MSAPSTTILFIAPTARVGREIGNQCPPVREGVRVITTTPSPSLSEHLRGLIIDTVIVLPEARYAGREEFFALVRSIHRGNGPWIEMDPDFVGVRP